MPIVPAVLGAIIGLGLFLVGLHKRRKLQASLSWPQTRGTIVGAGIEQSESGNSEDGYHTSFAPQVQYRYEVNGVAYVADRIAHTSRSYPRPVQAQAELLPYPINAPVAVFFNPEKPSDAVLVRKAPGTGFLLGAGLVIMAIIVAATIKELVH